jgi:DNA invertase Pin-like site-specific DNA recombinase
MSDPKRLRCAIYTRKSSEEGLEQGFNSLHAQREACEAYVLSQAGEGWTALKTVYDDGGYSGGSMNRPALQQLLADIEKGRIDTIVVYKMDRLTRSLADFAKMVEVFDAKGVSFVSVTQAFNTTSSMGRLTLNVLLSFAQFEREVTGERIRDKIAASKKKGMWMGGRAPLGYDPGDHRLVVNEAEAETVRHIFRRYLELGSVAVLQHELRTAGIRSKRRIAPDGREIGGAILSRGAIYHLLANPAYRGGLRHKDKVYEGAHDAIIDPETWITVRDRIASGVQERLSGPKLSRSALLQGLVFDDRGHIMQPVHTLKNGRRYRYYASAALVRGDADSAGTLPRIAAGVLEGFLLSRLETMLATAWKPDEPFENRLRAAIRKVTLGEERICVELDPEAVRLDPELKDGQVSRDTEIARVTFPIRLKHRHSAKLIEAAGQHPEPARRVDRALVRAVALARTWTQDLASGRVATIQEIARRQNLCKDYTAKLLPLAYLAPDLVEAILDGRQPQALSLGALIAKPLPMDWSEQRRLFASIG